MTKQIPAPLWDAIPERLTSLAHWVCWKLEYRDGKPTKVPYNVRTGAGAMSNKSETWASFAAARHSYEKGAYDGVGFMLDPETEIVGVDLDHCIDTATGALDELAVTATKLLQTYTEITPSGEGLRLFLRGKLPERGRKKGAVEMYENHRFLTVTGRHFGDTPLDIEERRDEILEFHRSVFGEEKARTVRVEVSMPSALSDHEVLERMFRAKNGAKAEALYDGQFETYFSSQSEADSALCCLLAFWTGRDESAVDRLFRSSGLMRDKWDQRRASDGRTYGQITVENAAGLTTESFEGEGGRAFLGGSAGFAGVESGKTVGKNGGFAGFAGEGLRESNEIEVPQFEQRPAPISTSLLPVHKLRPEDLPPSLRGWQTDIAHRMSVPLEYPVASALVGLSTIIGRRLAICPKQFDDWTVIPNLWGMVVGNPGQQKTPTTDESLKPLKRLEVEGAKVFTEKMKAHEAAQMVAKAKAKAVAANIEKGAKAGDSDAKLQLLALEARELEEAMQPPVQKRYIVNDVTIEALAVVLKNNPAGVLCVRDELSAFLKTLDKSGHEADRGFFLEAWNGNGSMTYDRIGRGLGLFIPAICVSLFGTIQPGVLARTVRGAASGEGADGLIQRFQVMMYPDPVPFKHVDRQPDTLNRDRAFNIYNNIATMPFSQMEELMGAQIDPADSSGIPFVRFTEDAQIFFNEWWTDLEVGKIRGHESPIIESHLAKYRSLMPSLALIFHLIEVVDGNASGPVSLEAATRAAGWCAILESHARRVYQMAFDGDPEPAMRLSERLKQSLPSPFTTRQVVKKGWSGLTTPEDVERAIDVLEDKGWIKTVEIPPTAQGGRPSKQHFINPEISSGDED